MKRLLLLIPVLFLFSFVLAETYNYDIDAVGDGYDVDLDIDVDVDTSDLQVNEDGSVSGEIRTDVKTRGTANGQEINERNREGTYQIQANRNGSASVNASITLPNGKVVTRTIERNANGTNVSLYINGVLVREGYRYRTAGGKNVTVKIMPEVASQRAIERLRLKNCSEENNCTIEFKEVGEGNETRLRYEVKAHEQGRFLGLFKRNVSVSIEIDAESGEEVVVKRKPLWIF